MSSVTAEVCQQYCEAAQKLTQDNGVYNTKQLPKLPGRAAVITVMRKKGFTEMPRKGIHKWVGPDTITIVTGESVLREYRKYLADHPAKPKPEAAKKTNGAKSPEAAKPSRLQQIEARLEALEDAVTSPDIDHRLQQIEAAIETIMGELR